MAADMGIDNHLSFCEDAKGTEEMFKHERMSRERFNLRMASDSAMPEGSYFKEL